MRNGTVYIWKMRTNLKWIQSNSVFFFWHSFKIKFNEKSLIWQCLCQHGYIGRTCDQKQKPCASNPCEGRGECFDKNGGFFCRYVRCVFVLFCLLLNYVKSDLASFLFIFRLFVFIFITLFFLHTCVVCVYSPYSLLRRDSTTYIYFFADDTHLINKKIH